MRAIIQTAYGSPIEVLRLAEVERPPVPADGVLVRVHAASVNAGDWRAIRASPFLIRLGGGFRRPRDPGVGVDAAGVVEAVGAEVTHLKAGDAAYGMRAGAFAEYVAGPWFAPMPANLSFEQAAAVPAAGCTALQAVRDHGRVEAGQRVLVHGAGGGVGTFVVQLARAFGAEVAAVTSTANVELLASIGVTEVIDYQREDVARAGRRFDLVIDIGANRSVSALRRVLKPDGRLVLVGAGKGPGGPITRLAGAWVRARLGQPVDAFIARKAFVENLQALKGLIEAGKVMPVIDRTYPLAETPQAIRYVESERARGKVVITI
jgi:NADPH:quinone reductase-like Zn-dependent oxidoreductase